jgi:uncharacterized SAM-binding protein YcdF (DUF218 family)
MFFLKKLITSLILPPGLLIIIFLFMAFCEKRKTLRFLGFISALFVYLISIEPFKDLLFYPLEKNYSIPKTLHGDAIVILGGGVYSLSSLTEDTSNRVLTGFLLYRKTKLPIIVSDGTFEGGTSDANAMAYVLKEMGVEPERIIEENKSKDTAQNAFYVSEICKTKGFKKLILVTSAYHLKRSEKLFKRMGLKVLPYPADFKRKNYYNIYSFLPKFSIFAASSKAIREYIALISIRNSP